MKEKKEKKGENGAYDVFGKYLQNITQWLQIVFK